MDNSKQFTFVCPYCGQRIAAETSMVGRVGYCPDCGKTLTIPKPPVVVPTPKPLRKGKKESKTTEPRKTQRGILAIGILILAIITALGFGAKQLHTTRSSNSVSRNDNSGDTSSSQITSGSNGNNSPDSQVQAMAALIALLGIAAQMNATPSPQPQREVHQGNGQQMGGGFGGYFQEVGDDFIQ